MNLIQKLGQQALFSFDAETAHGISIKALKSGIVPSCPLVKDARLGQTISGLDFPNPVGLAAGYDKNGEVPDAILKLGFGFTEVGTLTPRPQNGNPKPRVFRLIEHKGVINRLGFNNEGHSAALTRLEARKNNPGIVGINIGANKDSEDFVADYEKGIAAFAHLADYFTVNISSPNTPGLRNLQAGDALKKLLDRVFSARKTSGFLPPVFLKVAPDLNDNEIDDITKVISSSDLSGAMISNTTLSRAGVENHKNASQAGGLSGSPLFERSTIVLAKFRQKLPKTFPLVGIGGVGCADTAWAKLEAGASLVQLYSCMVYEGPNLAATINAGLLKRMELEKIDRLSDIVGTQTELWANKEI